MATRINLFNCWTKDEGEAFFLGHNKLRAENSVNMLMRLRRTADTKGIVQQKQIPQYKSVDLKYVGEVTLGMLPMKPLDLLVIEASLMPQMIIGKIYFRSLTSVITA